MSLPLRLLLSGSCFSPVGIVAAIVASLVTSTAIVIVVGGAVYEIGKRGKKGKSGAENEEATRFEFNEMNDEIQNLINYFYASDDYMVTKF